GMRRGLSGPRDLRRTRPAAGIHERHRVQRDQSARDQRCRGRTDHKKEGRPARRLGKEKGARILKFLDARRYEDFSFASLIPNSRNWRGSTSAGDCDIKSIPRLFFGKAITSRIESSPQSNITNRSKPIAMPPCGGAPSRNARSK